VTQRQLVTLKTVGNGSYVWHIFVFLFEEFVKEPCLIRNNKRYDSNAWNKGWEKESTQ